MTEIIDSHAHLTWDSFQADQAEVIQRALDSNVVQLVQAGVDFASIPEIVKLADTYRQIYFGVGLHPHDGKLWTDDSSAVRSEERRVGKEGRCRWWREQ